MFEFLFKYPAAVFSKGTLVLLGSWPKWMLFAGAIAAATIIGWMVWRRRNRLTPSLRGLRVLVLWSLQSALVFLLLLLLWEPAISVTALKPQENIVAVVIDDSRSMAIKDVGETRQGEAKRILDSGLVTALKKKFQVRLYRLGAGVDRIKELKELQADQSATQLSKGLRQIADEAATLPVGAVVLLSDGADNSGGVDVDTIAELRRRRLPINTIGIGRQELAKDVELDRFELPDKALKGSRLQAEVTIRQNGFGGQRAKLTLTGGGSVLATQDVVLKDSPEQVETVELKAGETGVRTIAAKLDPLPGEVNNANNRITRVIAIDDQKRRVLYIEGEPRWEYKFLRRAVEDDPALQVVSMLRTTQNKMYRQGIANPNELIDGFPSKAEDLFAYQGIILGSVEAAFFTPAQQDLIRQFVDRRGGGLLFLAGRWALSDGGYNIAPFAELLPVNLPTRKNTFQRTMVAAELSDAGKKSLICRIEDDREKSNNHWEILPYMANYQDPGTPKPGAVILARMNVGGNRLPLLLTENYGRGRTAVLATAGSWRWRMQQPVGDISQETFWRQLLRWQVAGTPSGVVASTPTPQLDDEGHLQIRAEIRDKNYQSASDAEVQARIVQPDGSSETVPLRPEPLTQGIYAAAWNATKPGAYAAEVTAKRGKQELGSDTLTFQRVDGFAENFHAEQNADLLKKLSEATGGRYYTTRNASHLPDEISYSQAGITARDLKDLWDMPAIFLVILILRSTEWLLRRRWGVV